jgi:cobalt-zinc-cadmium efflux system membrane fusion protein
MKKISILLALGVLLGSCQETVEEPHEHELDEFTQSHTVWTNKTELFVEYSPLIVGESSEFLAHFSEMEQFKSIDNGQVTVSLIEGTSGIRHKVDAPASPGIFKPSLTPKESGIYDLVFEISSGNLYDKITISAVEVFSSKKEMMNKIKHDEHGSNQISFLKEQAWKMEFANAPVQKVDVYNVIPSSGEIHAAIGDEKTIVATTSGIVMYSSTDVTIGAEVNASQKLFTVSGGNVNANNVQTEFMNAKANFTREKANLARKNELYDAGAIARAELENAQLSYDLAESNFQNISNNYSQKGKSISTSSHGFIKQLFKSEGQYVEAGEPLAVIAQNKRLTLESFVSQLDYQKLSPSISANFSLNGKVYAIEEFNGKFLSYGASITPTNPKIPIYFEMDNTGNLLPGSFVEVWLKTNVSKKALTVPKTALLEQYGKYSVIVQLAGETFEERDIMIGNSDGKNVEVTSGLKEDERVVTTGAYQIKMASMSGEIPAHGHAH